MAESPKFQRLNRFTFGRVIAEHVNTAKKHRKVNPIFGWSLASRQIITILSRDAIAYRVINSLCCKHSSGPSIYALDWPLLLSSSSQSIFPESSTVPTTVRFFLNMSLPNLSILASAELQFDNSYFYLNWLLIFIFLLVTLTSSSFK